MEVISTDVLVIGGGIAGLSAAITAQKNGMNVLLCSKTTPGLASSSALSGGGFRSQNSSFSADEHKQLTLKGGHYLNEPLLVDTLVENGLQAIMSLREYGVNIKERAKGFYVPAEKKGREGLNITRPMANYARSIGVKFLSSFMAYDLLHDEGRAVGVWGVLKSEGGKLLAIAARVIVLATGGGGTAFLRTDNPPGTTGDGYCLAYRAGLSLMDMEFIQFYPLAPVRSKAIKGIIPPILADVGRFFNINGDNLVEKYNINKVPLAIASRDALSRAISLEVANGNGVDGAIKLDLGVSQEDWERAGALWGYTQSHMEGVMSWTNKILAGGDHLLVMPTAHFFIGGVVANGWGETNIPGLFVAGEISGGLHGANRVGGNALTEAVIFGHRAGQKASEYAKKRRDQPSLVHQINTLAEKAWEILNEQYIQIQVKRDIAPTEFNKNIRRLFWKFVGVLRSEPLLAKAAKELESYQKEITFVNYSGISGLTNLLENLNMLLLGKIIYKSAIIRQESRGAHYRSDFPLQFDENWKKHILVQKKNQDMVQTTCKIGFLS